MPVIQRLDVGRTACAEATHRADSLGGLCQWFLSGGLQEPQGDIR